LISADIPPEDYHARCGVSIEKVRILLRHWPDFDDQNDQKLAGVIHECLNEVCNGIAFDPEEPDVPAMRAEDWPKWFSFSRKEMQQVFQRWRDLRKAETEWSSDRP
jgi:hypothetical protein